MVNVVDDIAAFLSVAASTGWTESFGIIGPPTTEAIYKLQRPASTARMHIIYLTGGQGPKRVQGAGVDGVNIQVMTLANATSDLGYAMALKIQERLRFVNNRWLPTSTGTAYYISITPSQAPIALGPDQNGRHQWSQNFVIELSAT